MDGFQLILYNMWIAHDKILVFSYNLLLFVHLTRIRCISLLSNFNSVLCHAFIKSESSTVVLYPENKRKTLSRMW